MSHITCSEAQTKLQKITSLKDQFLHALEEVNSASSPEHARVYLTLAQILKERLNVQMPELSREFVVTTEQAREIMGQDFYGTEEIKVAYGFELTDDQIPEIPYTKENLEWAKKKNMMLMLFLDTDGEGNPLTGERINSIMTPRIAAIDGGKFLFHDTPVYANNSCFTTETAICRWRLVGKDPLLNSKNKNYVEQTKLLRDYLEREGLLADEERKECTDTLLTELDQMSTRDRQKETTEQLATLRINQNHRLSLIEELQKLALSFGARTIRFLPVDFVWTNSCTSDGRLVSVGGFGWGGLEILGSFSDYKDDVLGVCIVL